MAYADDTPMPEILADMAAVAPAACHEFARRQAVAGHGDDLHQAARLLHDVAFSVQLDRPAELHAWKYPETFEPVDIGLLKAVLQAASEGDADSVKAQLADQTFATVTALSSLATHLRQASEQIARFGTQRPDPQQPLF